MQLNVDMRLGSRSNKNDRHNPDNKNDDDDSNSEEDKDEEQLRKRVPAWWKSEKRQRRKVVEEDESDEEEEEEDNNDDKNFGIKRDYKYESEPPQQNTTNTTTEYEFELPPCDSSSSSSEEETERQHPLAASSYGSHNHQPQDQSCDSNEVAAAASAPVQQSKDRLLDDGFFTEPAWYHDASNKENLHVSYLNESNTTRRPNVQEEERTFPIEVVDLCCSNNGNDNGDDEYKELPHPDDDDDDEDWEASDEGYYRLTAHPVQPQQTTQTRFGLRTQSMSPRFNLHSRAACLPTQQSQHHPWDHLSSHSAAAPEISASLTVTPFAATVALPTQQYHNDDNDDDQDDIVDCWSSDDEQRPTVRPRRVTDYPIDHHPSTSAMTAETFVPAPHRRVAQAQQSFLQHSFTEQRRVRDATASNHSLAKLVVTRTRKIPPPVSLFASYNNQGQPVAVTAPPPASAAAASFSASHYSFRDDLVGGFGVGAGNYIFLNNNNSHPTASKKSSTKTTTAAAASRAAPKKRKASTQTSAKLVFCNAHV